MCVFDSPDLKKNYIVHDFEWSFELDGKSACVFIGYIFYIEVDSFLLKVDVFVWKKFTQISEEV